MTGENRLSGSVVQDLGRKAVRESTVVLGVDRGDVVAHRKAAECRLFDDRFANVPPVQQARTPDPDVRRCQEAMTELAWELLTERRRAD